LLVEAHLLARRTTAEIAGLTNISASVIDVFEAIFFNCRDFLHANDWITLQAIHNRQRMQNARDAILKSFAYHGGPIALDAVTPYVLGIKDPFEQVSDLTTPAGRREQSIRLAVAAMLLPQGPENDMKLQKLMLLLREPERKAPVSTAPTSFKTRSPSFSLPTPSFDANQGANADDRTPVPATDEVAKRQSA